MSWLSAPWPCLGLTGSHGSSDVMVVVVVGRACVFGVKGWGGKVLCVNTQGSDPTGSLSVNRNSHTTACLPGSAVCYCVSLLFSRQKYQIQAVGGFTECDLKVGLRRNDVPGSLEKELPEREMARIRPNTINLLFTTLTALRNAADEVFKAASVLSVFTLAVM